MVSSKSRPTASNVLQHIWLNGGADKQQHLDAAPHRLKQLINARKLQVSFKHISSENTCRLSISNSTNDFSTMLAWQVGSRQYYNYCYVYIPYIWLLRSGVVSVGGPSLVAATETKNRCMPKWTYCVSQKIPKSPALQFSDIFSQTVGNFYTHLLHVPIYARWQIFIQLSPILMKLCHIKRDYLVHVICSKWRQSAETRAFRRLWRSLIALLIVICGKLSK